MKNRIFLLIAMMFSISKAFAVETIVAIPGSMDNTFRMEAYRFVEDMVNGLEKGEVVVFLSDENLQSCKLIGVGNKRANYSAFMRLSLSRCKQTLKPLTLKSDGDNILDIPKVIEYMLANYNKQSDFQLILIGSPLYKDHHHFDFSRGYPSLGFLEQSAKDLSPFIGRYTYSFSKQAVFVLYPSSDSYVTNLDSGQFTHENKIRYFWFKYLSYQGLKLASFNRLVEGIPKKSIDITYDQAYEETRRSIYFVDLLTLSSKSRYQPGEKIQLISKNIQGVTKEYYSFTLNKKGKVESIFFREWDGDSDIYPNINVKFNLIFSDGNAEEHYLTPSMNDQWKQHTITPNRSSGDLIGISIYPVENGKPHNFHGEWTISDLIITFK
ncbi:hypothetical protein BOO24_18190 [Vibrio navarrensis]|uniref:hypothetical protein n=1 Tax=Vibrio navarrensis TaxID=29495 RepID=UPI00186A61FF|nr:hypothetical protein [Vibrio navarrensis]MBE3671141.1 hypothetical protein [Vibrio navarrensis]MBE4594270.1 hypothetical protein [Vibrio navarrensis]